MLIPGLIFFSTTSGETNKDFQFELGSFIEGPSHLLLKGRSIKKRPIAGENR